MNLNKIVEFVLRPDVAIWLIIVVVYVLSKIGVGLSYLSVWDIIRGHIDCFRAENTRKILIIPFIDYCVIPFLLGAAATETRIIDSAVVNIITIIVSILTSMLFTLLAMINDMKSKINDNPMYYSKDAEISTRCLYETYHTVMFEILISVILLVLCLFNVFTSRFGWFQSFLIYSFTFLLIINLLMIIKRIFRVIDADMNKK